jgi:hypothetical protein
MVNSQPWSNTTCIRLRDNDIAYGHAMPVGLMPQRKNNNGVLIGFTVFCALATSVPISRGSPPISG